MNPEERKLWREEARNYNEKMIKKYDKLFLLMHSDN